MKQARGVGGEGEDRVRRVRKSKEKEIGEWMIDAEI